MEVLIVDDSQQMRLILRAILESEGYTVTECKDGLEAWNLLMEREDYPRLVLTDWVMPNLEGTELIKKIKSEPKLKSIYACLVTTKDKVKEVVDGLGCGADDYIAKPFEKNELLARVKAGIRVIDLLESIRLEKARSNHLQSMAFLGEMAGGVAHEINNPLTILTGELFKLNMKIKKGEFTEENLKTIHGNLEKNIIRISHIIKGLMEFSKEDSSEGKSDENILQIWEDTLNLSREKLKKYEVKLDIDLKLSENPILHCVRNQIAHVFFHLLSNSFDAVKKVKDRRIKIELAESSTGFTFKIYDSGEGIDSELRDKIMVPFFSTKDVGEGTGLGLSVIKGTVENYGGEFNLLPGKPTTFKIFLPKDPEGVKKAS